LRATSNPAGNHADFANQTGKAAAIGRMEDAAFIARGERGTRIKRTRL
jgi:carbamate kinase